MQIIEVMTPAVGYGNVGIGSYGIIQMKEIFIQGPRFIVIITLTPTLCASFFIASGTQDSNQTVNLGTDKISRGNSNHYIFLC